MHSVLLAKRAILLDLQPAGIILFVFRRRVVTVLAIRTFQRDDHSHI